MSDIVQASPLAMPKIRKIDADQPWRWLSAGWKDLWRAPTVGLSYGLLFAVGGWVLTAFIWVAEIFSLVLPMMAGFMLVAPILSVGLYDASRRLEDGRPVTLGGALTAWRVNTSQIALMGVALMLFLLAWLRLATLLFALFFGSNPPRPEPMFLLDVFASSTSLPFLAVGTAIGGVLAAAVFAISAVSIPLLLDRNVNVIMAIASSFEAVRQNFWPMALWAWLIALFIGAGLVTGYIGLIVTLPLIGHATWYAYRDLIEWDD